MFGVEATGDRVEGGCPLPELELVAGTVTLITGASGSGKSSLLRKIRSARWVDVDRVRMPKRAVVDCFGEEELERVLLRLGRVGLGEVWTYLRKPGELSEGQRWRLKLAMALRRCERRRAGGVKVLVADEFAAVLDSVTAHVVARCLSRTVRSAKDVAAVVASSREDLVEALRPDVIVRCDFGKVEVIETLG